uniref:Exportin-1/Importin-beta-like domain-containing protein n=1 Tax=Aegilops tauschii TaxID=37682 RepID=M8BJB7_AEGTA
MLRRKIQSPDYSLPDNAAQLLDALLVAARRFCLAPPRLLTQICLALAALALRAEGGVDGLFARMPHLPDPALLELLTVLPEEVAQDESGDTGVDSATRCRFARELLMHAPAVLEFLLAQSEKPAAADGVPLHERNHRILRCLLSWAFFSFEVAIEVMTELVSQYQELPQAFLSKMPYIREVLLLPALANRSEKIIAGLTSLMCEVGQAHRPQISKGVLMRYRLSIKANLPPHA